MPQGSRRSIYAAHRMHALYRFCFQTEKIISHAIALQKYLEQGKLVHRRLVEKSFTNNRES
jgi:hypothetical protein